MNYRKRAAILRGLGYEQSPLALTRGTVTFVHPETKAKITIPKGTDGNMPFMALGQYSVVSALINISNTSAGALEEIERASADTAGLIPHPDELLPGMGNDQLFVGYAKANARVEVAA
jgi:hypothetical protein